MISPMQLMQMARSGNPMQALMQMSKTNPQVGQVLQMVNGKTPAEMQRMAYDIAKQRGVDLNQLAQQLGVRLPR